MPTKLVKTDEDFETGFSPAANGKYRWEIQEGIEVIPTVTGKMYYKIPMKVDAPIPGEGEDEAVGAFGTRKIWIESQHGEKEMNNLINSVDLLDVLKKRFGDEVDFLDDKVIEFMKLRLIGKFVVATHILSEWKNDKGETKYNPDFKKFFMPKRKAQVTKVDTKEEWEEGA